jgi:hypothetical protein
VSVSRRTFCLRSASAVAALVTGLSALARDDDKDDKKPKKKDRSGKYRVEIRGYYTGDGWATVTATSVSIDANVKDEAGRRTQLKAENLKLARDRFSGQGTASNLKVNVSGRVDPPTGAVKVGRVTATYGTSTNRYGRISGEYKNPL